MGRNVGQNRTSDGKKRPNQRPKPPNKGGGDPTQTNRGAGIRASGAYKTLMTTLKNGC